MASNENMYYYRIDNPSVNGMDNIRANNNNQVDASTFQERMATAKGRFVVIEFLIGTTNMVTRNGILYDVGNSYIVLYDPCRGTYTSCDLYSIKFITVYEEGKPSAEEICNLRRYGSYITM